MENNCPYFDTTLTSFYNKPHCRLHNKEITEDQYAKNCQSDDFRRCPYFIKLCEKVFTDDEEILEILNKLKGQTD